MSDLYVILHRHIPVLIVDTLDKARSYCESQAGNGWTEHEQGNTEVYRYEIGYQPSILDYKIYKVFYVSP